MRGQGQQLLGLCANELTALRAGAQRSARGTSSGLPAARGARPRGPGAGRLPAPASTRCRAVRRSPRAGGAICRTRLAAGTGVCAASAAACLPTSRRTAAAAAGCSAGLHCGPCCGGAREWGIPPAAASPPACGPGHRAPSPAQHRVHHGLEHVRDPPDRAYPRFLLHTAFGTTSTYRCCHA